MVDGAGNESGNESEGWKESNDIYKLDTFEPEIPNIDIIPTNPPQ